MNKMASRFALLNPDVDLDERLGKKKEDKSKNVNLKKTQSTTKTNNNRRKKQENDLQTMAFGSKIKTKKKSKTGEGKENGVNCQVRNPDEDWKQRDDQFVRDENERSLREAIMASKLEFEEKKDNPTTKKKDSSEEVSRGGKVKKKKDKPLTISLDQFNSLRPGQLAGLNDPSSGGGERLTSPTEVPPEDETFFADVDETTRKTLEREDRKETYRATAREFSDEIKAVNYEGEIEKRDFEIQALRLEVESLKTDLNMVKIRNKKLCEVISLAEMRSKGEMVLELEKVTKARDEFSQEVTRLSAELEQEKTKVSQVTNDLKKAQGKKRHNPDTSGKD